MNTEVLPAVLSEIVISDGMVSAKRGGRSETGRNKNARNRANIMVLEVLYVHGAEVFAKTR